MATQIKIFRRKVSFGAAAPLEIVLDGETVTSIANGEELTIDVENRPSRIAFLSTGFNDTGVVLQEVECPAEGDIYIELGYSMQTGQLDILAGNIKYENITEKSKYFMMSLFLIRFVMLLIIVGILVLASFIMRML